ncbi:MAG TPA: alpha/beta hydrolase [Chloroflexia bacterium]|nr:alpha/beta hydrolase [Chloroflexia bacterium]
MAKPTSVHHTEAGQGLPLVLVHGFPFDGTIWAAQLAALGDVARLLVPDLPGFGHSTPLPGPPEAARIEHYAAALLAWADGLGLASFTLAGHSMGGYVALAVARLAPARLAGLVLVGSRAGADTSDGVARRYALAAAVAEHGPIAAVDAMLPRLLGSPYSRQTAQVREIMLRQSTSGLLPAIYAMATRPDSTAALATIAAPALLLAGTDDATIPPSESELMRDHLRSAAYVEIPGAGHVPMLEAPEAVNAALRPFVAGLRPPILVPPGS